MVRVDRRKIITLVKIDNGWLVDNFIRTENIRNVIINEILTPNFEAEYSTLTPHPKYVANIMLGGQKLDCFYWELGDIAPLTTKTVWFNFRYCGPPQGNVEVDLTKPPSQVIYTTLDGNTHTISAGSDDPSETWYGDNSIDAGSLNVAPSESLKYESDSIPLAILLE